MEVLKDNYGGYEISPIDYFHGTVPVEKWIVEKPSEDDIKNGPDNYAIDQIISYWFLFKEENNGSTYRVFHKSE